MPNFTASLAASQTPNLHCSPVHLRFGSIGATKSTAHLNPKMCTLFLADPLFNFAIGNGDAHKKNVSLLTTDDTVALSPVYDLVSSRFVIPDEADDLALPAQRTTESFSEERLSGIRRNPAILVDLCRATHRSYPRPAARIRKADRRFHIRRRDTRPAGRYGGKSAEAA